MKKESEGIDELYDLGPQLSKLNSTNALIKHIDELYNEKKIGGVLDTLVYVEILSNTIKKRFQHGLSNYSFSDNWIAFFCAKLFWSHFSAIIIPEDILKHKVGICSQQTIVFLHTLQHKGINARSVGLGKKEGPGHFLAEVRYEGEWHTYDVSSEPDWSKLIKPHQSMEFYSQRKDSLYKVYEGRMPIELFNSVMMKVDYGGIGEFPAKKMFMFHRITYYITILLPCLFLLLLIKSVYRKNNNQNNL